MKAIVQRRYGSPDRVLTLRDLDMPSVNDDDVLVRVYAASIHPDVWHVVTGRPYVLRVMGAGLLRPKIRVPGTDVAGYVESVGRNVVKFEPGDEVFGEIVRGHQWKNGSAYAEYASVSADALELKPANLTFEQAAAVPTSALIALRNLRARGRIQPGQNILINGAGGSVGTFAVQIAKADGAAVTAVDTASKLNMLRSIGADQVIDYAQEDFTRSGEHYDLIVDVPGNRSFSDLRRALTDDGIYVLVGHDDFGRSGGRFIGGTSGRFLKLLITSPFGGQRTSQRSSTKKRDPMIVLKELIEAGKITPVIDRTYPLSEVPEAIRYLETGNAQGKVVITVKTTGKPE